MFYLTCNCDKICGPHLNFKSSCIEWNLMRKNNVPQNTQCLYFHSYHFFEIFISYFELEFKISLFTSIYHIDVSQIVLRWNNGLSWSSARRTMQLRLLLKKTWSMLRQKYEEHVYNHFIFHRVYMCTYVL